MKTITFIANLEKIGGIETVFFNDMALLSKRYNIQLVSLRHLPQNICKMLKNKHIQYTHPLPPPMS